MKTKKPDDLHFITHPDSWPHWPVLPLVGIAKQAPQVGLLWASDDPIVIVGPNLFSYLTENLNQTWGEWLAPYPRITYPTFTALLTEWRID